MLSLFHCLYLCFNDCNKCCIITQMSCAFDGHHHSMAGGKLSIVHQRSTVPSSVVSIGVLPENLNSYCSLYSPRSLWLSLSSAAWVFDWHGEPPGR